MLNTIVGAALRYLCGANADRWAVSIPIICLLVCLWLFTRCLCSSLAFNNISYICSQSHRNHRWARCAWNLRDQALMSLWRFTHSLPFSHTRTHWNAGYGPVRHLFSMWRGQGRRCSEVFSREHLKMQLRYHRWRGEVTQYSTQPVCLSVSFCFVLSCSAHVGGCSLFRLLCAILLAEMVDMSSLSCDSVAQHAAKLCQHLLIILSQK